MKILFITRDFSGASLCLHLHREGNDIRAFVADSLYMQILDGLIKKIINLNDGIAWVGLDGLIVIDDVGFGELQDCLRTHRAQKTLSKQSRPQDRIRIKGIESRGHHTYLSPK